MPRVGGVFRRVGRNTWKYKDRITVTISFGKTPKWARRDGYGIFIEDTQGKYHKIITGMKRWTDAYAKVVDEMKAIDKKLRAEAKNL